MTVMVTSPKCSLPSCAPLAACQTQLCQCAVKMWKNTPTLSSMPLHPLQPATARASSPQTPPSPDLCAGTSLCSLGSSVFTCPTPAEPPSAGNLQSLHQAQASRKAAETHPRSKPLALGLPLPCLAPLRSWGGHVWTWLSPMQTRSCSPFTLCTQPPKAPLPEG